MSVSLFEHNHIAYEAALLMLNERGKAAVIHPTGTGKSFIAFKLCEEQSDRRICFLSPSEYIFRTQKENWNAAGGGELPNVTFYTYAKLALMKEAELSELRPDYIILDEFHRCGAAVWGAGVERLLSMYREVPVLGLSATNIRYLDRQRDMADELFDGNIASELTLGDAIVQGILNPPKYVLSVYSYQRELSRYEERLKTAKSRAVREEGKKALEELRRALRQAEGLPEVFAKHMEARNGKYIVFCAGFEHMHEMMELVPEWFAKVDPAPQVYSVYSEDAQADAVFSQFKDDKSGHLKLLFCIDMLNEGIHVEDVDGVILLRPTVSPIVYKQQIGRALSAGKEKTAVIFDVVMNIENLYSVGAIEEEMQTALDWYRRGGQTDRIRNESFQVYDEVKDCVRLFQRLNATLSASWELMYGEARRYFEEHGHLRVTKRYVTSDGFTLGAWVSTQRRVRAGKMAGTLTKEQIALLDEIGMPWEGPRTLNWERNYAAAKRYFEKHGNLLVSTGELRKETAVTSPEEGSRLETAALGKFLAQLRVYRKNGMKSSYLTEERIAALDAIGMVWDVPDYFWEKNYRAAERYYTEHGSLDVPSYYVDAEGVRLGSWVAGMRSARGNERSKRTALTAEQIARLDRIGMIWDGKHSLTWERAYEEACKYKEKHGDLNIPVAYVTKSGCRLGKWLRHQRDAYREGRLSAGRKEKLSAIGMVFEPEDAWESKFRLVQRYYEEHGHLRIPNDYVSEGVWIARWLSEQASRMNDGGETKKPLTTEQIAQLESLGLRKNVSRQDILWEEQYEQAKEYYIEHGNLAMPKRYVGSNGKNVGVWLQRQRRNHTRGILPEGRAARLDEIGMVWEARS